MTPNERYKKLFTESKTIPTELCEKVTWVDLAVKRMFGSLIPGEYYRITDYNTVVVDEGVGSEFISSAGHQFDIIVLALTEDRLSDDAFATYSESDNNYFNGYLENWKLKYSPFGDVYREYLADCYNVNSIEFTINVKNGQAIEDPQWNDIETDSETGEKFVTFAQDQVNYLIPYAQDPTSATYMYVVTNGEESKTKVEILGVSYEIPQSEQAEARSKGIIYNMIDEWGNEAPYDFKNITIKGEYITSYILAHFGSIVANIDDDAWYYTFFSIQNGIEDASLYDGCTGNKIVETANFQPSFSGIRIPSVFLQGENFDNTFIDCYNVVCRETSSIKVENTNTTLLTALVNCKISYCSGSNLNSCGRSSFNRVISFTMLPEETLSGYRFEDIDGSITFRTTGLSAPYQTPGWIVSQNESTTNGDLIIYRHLIVTHTTGDAVNPYTGVYWDIDSMSWKPINRLP